MANSVLNIPFSNEFIRTRAFHRMFSNIFLNRLQQHINSSPTHLPLHPAVEQLFDQHGPSMYALLLRGCEADHEKADELMEKIFLAFNGSLHAKYAPNDRHIIRLLRIAIQHGHAQNVKLVPVIRQILSSPSPGGETQNP